MTREYTCPPGDSTSCPKCDAKGGPAGAIRVRGIMIEQQYNDRRCNSCGHLWTGGTLDLPLDNSILGPSQEEKAVEPTKDYDFGDGWKPDPGSAVPF